MVSSRVGRFVFVSAALALTCFLPSARAQDVPAPTAPSIDPARDWSDDVPAHLSFVEGQVTLERDGRLEPAEPNLALLAGDRIHTLGGRVEILFVDGSALAVDENTQLDLLSDSLVRLLEGRLRLTIPRTTDDLDYRIDAPAGSVSIRTAGEYRVETGVNAQGDPQVDLTVFRGSAELFNELGRTLVRAGKYAVAVVNTEPSLPYAANSAAWDDFDRWADDRREARLGPVSEAYLPEELLDDSGAFDVYGTWGYDATYGNVWYPRVAAEWRPYSQGRWSFTAHYGWLWVGIDRWSWPTHHYGRWGISARGWYWIPDRLWAPAWVAWAAAPGYVSWCPLGFNGRSVIGFRSTGRSYGDPWAAWTVVPAHQFTHDLWVTGHVVAANAIPPAVRGEFVERPVAPAPVGPAIPRREIAPIHGPTAPRGVAVPRAAARGPFDGARTSDRNAAASTRDSIKSAVVDLPAWSDGSRGAPAARAVKPAPSAPTPRPNPRSSPAGTPVAPRISAPTVEVPKVDLGRSGSPRAVPRPIDPPTTPPDAYEPPRILRRAPDPVRPEPPAATVRSRDRWQAPERMPQPQPPPPAVKRGPNPEAPEYSSPPPPAAPPASRAPRMEPPAAKPPAVSRPPAAKPPASPPPARGGGQGKVGRRGGGGR